MPNTPNNLPKIIKNCEDVIIIKLKLTKQYNTHKTVIIFMSLKLIIGKTLVFVS